MRMYKVALSGDDQNPLQNIVLIENGCGRTGEPVRPNSEMVFIILLNGYLFFQAEADGRGAHVFFCKTVPQWAIALSKYCLDGIASRKLKNIPLMMDNGNHLAVGR